MPSFLFGTGTENSPGALPTRRGFCFSYALLLPYPLGPLAQNVLDDQASRDPPPQRHGLQNFEGLTVQGRRDGEREATAIPPLLAPKPAGQAAIETGLLARLIRANAPADA